MRSVLSLFGTSDFSPTACVECVECEEQMLPLYLSLLMASVTPPDGQINFTNVTPLFSAAIKPSADQTFDAVVMLVELRKSQFRF